MEVVNQKTNIKIYWKIFRGENKVSEDFNNSCTSLNVYLVGACDKYVYTPKVNTTIEPGYQVLEIDIPANSIREGAYDIKAIWKKNERTILTTSRCGVFGLTDSTEEAAVEDLKTIRIASYVESYGRDGMSAYETAVMYGLNEGIVSEKEWIENTISRINIVQTAGYSEQDVMSQKAVTEAILNHTGSGSGGGSVVIPQGSITTEMLGSGSVTKDKLADDAVTESKIKDKSVSHEKLSLTMQMIISMLQEGYMLTDNRQGDLRFYGKHDSSSERGWSINDEMVTEEKADHHVIYDTRNSRFMYCGPWNNGMPSASLVHYPNFNIKSLGISSQGYAYNPNIKQTFIDNNNKHYQWDVIGSDIVEVLAVSDVNAKAEQANTAAQAASTAAGNAMTYAQSLTARLERAEQISNNASATATSANNTAIAASSEVANLRAQLDGKVGSTTITAMELITQSAYDIKKAEGKLSDTTAYLITE